jgi:hypothetical protein
MLTGGGASRARGDPVPAGSPLMLTSEAGAFVTAARANHNFGADTVFSVGPRSGSTTYLRFNIMGMPAT